MDVTLEQARVLVGACRGVVDGAVGRLAERSGRGGRVDLALLDRDQGLAYDVATVAGRVTAAEHLLTYGELGALERHLAVLYAGEVAADLAGRLAGREVAWALDAGSPWSGGVGAALAAARSPGLLAEVAGAILRDPDLPRHLGGDLAMVRASFRAFSEARVAPVAEEVHRDDLDLPEPIIAGLAEMGCFGLSIPERFGGFAEGEGPGDLLSMMVVTEELSRGSLGAAGSLITRPEILSRALLSGGTPEQRERWLPGIATGELMCAVAVTEPDHGSDVAGLTVSAVRDGDDYVVDGTKTWCTFAGRADLVLLLARTGTAGERHRGLSLFVLEKPPYPGHAWTHEGQGGGRIEARAIGTLGYRGMHSFELAFSGYRVPAVNLVGGTEGLGRGFYLQVDAFANGRLQTAARALGVMQAAFEAAVTYANAREVFGVPLAAYQLTQAKLARMAAAIAACRWFSHAAARLLAGGDGQLQASMVKSVSCLAAEWLTREAMQIHGGMGYAEEYAVSRYFVDARVLSIFEGADETLALRVIVRRLIEERLRL